MKFCSRRVVLAGLALMVADLASAEPKLIQLVAIGDSLTAGYGLKAGEDVVTRLEAALKARGYAVNIVNAGVSGDTTQGGLDRLDWSLPDGVDGAIIELGANDALRGLPPERVEANLEAMLKRLSERKVKVLLAGMMAPPNLGEAYEKAFNAIYPRLAAKYGATLYPFFLDGVAADPALNQRDGIHPTARGIEVIVERILPTVEAFVSAIKSP